MIDLIWFHIKRWMVAAACGGAVVLVFSIVTERGSPVVYQTVQEATPVAIRAGYVGVLIDRNRKKICATHSTRILIRTEDINGEEIPVILPLQETGIIWPVKGRSKFLLLVPLPANLPPGQWFTQSISTDYCNWWDFLSGGTIRPSPLVAISSAAVSAAKDAP